MGVMRRLWGVLVIVRALLPILMVLDMVSIGLQAMAEARVMLGPPNQVAAGAILQVGAAGRDRRNCLWGVVGAGLRGVPGQ